MCVDWEWAAHCYDIVQENIKELAIEFSQNDENDVHLFPVMVTDTEEEEIEQKLRSIKRGTSPIAHIKSTWETWKVQKNADKPLLMLPNVEEAPFEEQASQFYWQNAFNYHFIAAHAYFHSPYPILLASWSRTERWFSQMDAKVWS